MPQGRQIALKKALLRGFFTDCQNLSEHEILAHLAAEAGLEVDGARRVLASADYANEVRELEAFYRERGINAVPAMVLNGRQVVCGSQSVSYYERCCGKCPLRLLEPSHFPYHAWTAAKARGTEKTSHVDHP